MRDPLAQRAAVDASATTLIDADADERLTVAALDAAVDRTAGRLATLGVRAGDRLGVVLPTRPATVRVVHAAMRLGAVVVPLGPGLAPTDLADRLTRAGPTAVVCGAGTEGDVLAAGATAADEVPVVSVDDPDDDRVAALGDRSAAAVAPHDWSLDATLFVPFTSGTTGAPKGVRLTLRNVLASAVASAFRLGLDRDEVWHLALPLHHVGGLSQVFRAPLYGTTLVLRGSFEADAVAADVERYGVTATSLVPTTLSRLLDATAGSLGSSLRAVLLGGAPAPESLLDRCRERSVPVFPTYGMTETASQIVTATPATARAHPGTVGRPLFGTDLAVRDEDGDELPAGEVGEFVVAGPTVSPGYLGESGGHGPHGLRTGDVGCRDEDGRVWVCGRVDDRIVTGGENVAPATVEAALRAHTGVAEAAVVGLDDPEWGERVAALVVARSGADLDAATLTDHCRDRLAPHEVPKTVRVAGTIPRTDSGTVRRDAVRARLRE